MHLLLQVSLLKIGLISTAFCPFFFCDGWGSRSSLNPSSHHFFCVGAYTDVVMVRSRNEDAIQAEVTRHRRLKHQKFEFEVSND